MYILLLANFRNINLSWNQWYTKEVLLIHVTFLPSIIWSNGKISKGIPESLPSPYFLIINKNVTYEEEMYKGNTKMASEGESYVVLVFGSFLFFLYFPVTGLNGPSFFQDEAAENWEQCDYKKNKSRRYHILRRWLRNFCPHFYTAFVLKRRARKQAKKLGGKREKIVKENSSIPRWLNHRD